MDTSRRSLSAVEAAERLGVKRQTLYAYVSRGLLTSRPAAQGRGSEFDADEVEDLLRRSRRQNHQELTVTTSVTSVRGGLLRYRGHDVLTLAAAESFEAVANLLWTNELTWVPCTAPTSVVT